MACIHSQCIPGSQDFPVCWTGSYSWALRYCQAHSCLEPEQSEHDLRKTTAHLWLLYTVFHLCYLQRPDWTRSLVNNTLLLIIIIAQVYPEYLKKHSSMTSLTKGISTPSLGLPARCLHKRKSGNKVLVLLMILANQKCVFFIPNFIVRNQSLTNTNCVCLMTIWDGECGNSMTLPCVLSNLVHILFRELSELSIQAEDTTTTKAER